MTDLHPIDWIDLKKAIADLADKEKAERRRCISLVASDDRAITINVHRDYWLSLAKRHEQKAAILDEIWQELGHDPSRRI